MSFMIINKNWSELVTSYGLMIPDDDQKRTPYVNPILSVIARAILRVRKRPQSKIIISSSSNRITTNPERPSKIRSQPLI